MVERPAPNTEREPGFFSVLVTLDYTPFYGTDSLRSAVEKCVLDAVGIPPHWFKSSPQRLDSTFDPNRDIHWALAARMNDYLNARFNFKYPEVCVVNPGVLTELAWTDFWEATEFLAPERAQNHRDVIVDITLSRERGIPLPDISCAFLLSPAHVAKTILGAKPTGWFAGGPPEGIELFNHCLRSSARKYADSFPNLLVIDLEYDPEVDLPDLDLEAQFQILTGYLSEHLRSHTPIERSYRGRKH